MTQTDPTETVAPRPVRPAAAELAAGTLVGSRYEIVRRLGAGGYAVVYLARDHRLKREIALKVLRRDRFSEAARRRFRREVQVARDVVCPQLLRIFDIGDDGELTYLTMELVKGASLKARLADGPPAIDEAVRIASEVLRGLEHLHGHGIVHRDVKPGNVLLAEDGTVKLADFGLVRRYESDETCATDTGSLVGTVDYMSPEQALGGKVGPPSDLYGLGVVLFESLTGKLPYAAGSSFGTVLAHIHKPAADSRRHRSEVPRWLGAVVARLLEKDPGDRYPSAAEALAALTARQAAWFHRFGFLRRRRSRWRLAGAVVLTVMATAAAMRWWPRPGELPTIGRSADGQIESIAADGRILWRKRVWGAKLARIHPGEPPRVVAFLEDPSRPGEPDGNTLGILDLETGEIMAQRLFSGPPHTFRTLGFSDHFSRSLAVDDLDGDGIDEVILQYFHRTQWPSYLWLYEPRFDRQRQVLLACGHHPFAGSADVDGDGNVELLFGGTNNCLGWKKALAAVKLDPPLDEGGPAGGAAVTPGDVPSYFVRDLLHWYALLPTTTCISAQCVHIDTASRQIELDDRFGGTPVTVGFDGFRKGSSLEATVTGEERQVLRRSAYRRLAEAGRLLRSGLPEQALDPTREARGAAAAAGDDQLVEWLGRVEAQLLAMLGRLAEAEGIIRAVAVSSESPGDAAYDLATALHVAGYLERAVHWYRQGLGPGGEPVVGRFKFELVFGLVLALVELERFDEARSAIARFDDSVHQISLQASCRAYIRWRRGEQLELPASEGPSDVYDLFRYWQLEFRRYLGEGPAELLPETVTELELTSEEYRALTRSLRAELLVAAGRLAEGIELVRDAHAQVQIDMLVYPVARAHYGVVTRRVAELARRAGREEIAVAAEEAFRQWQREQRQRWYVEPATAGAGW